MATMNEIDTPGHYSRFKIQPAEFIFQNDLEYWRGNIIKYACRAGYKGGWEDEIKDLEKLQRYAQMRINEILGDDVVS